MRDVSIGHRVKGTGIRDVLREIHCTGLAHLKRLVPRNRHTSRSRQVYSSGKYSGMRLLDSRVKTCSQVGYCLQGLLVDSFIVIGPDHENNSIKLCQIGQMGMILTMQYLLSSHRRNPGSFVLLSAQCVLRPRSGTHMHPLISRGRPAIETGQILRSK